MLYIENYKIDPHHHVLIKSSSRAKRIQIKIMGSQAHLIIPKSSSYEKAINFLHSKKDWIIEKTAINNQRSISNVNSFIVHQQGQIFGKTYFLVHQNVKSITISEDKIILNLDKKNIEQKLAIFFNLWLRKEILQLVYTMTDMIGVKHNTITIKKMRSRWGSWSSNKQLTFNEKLIFTDLTIIKYLVAHEVSHLKEMNHSKNFWQIVNKLDSNWLISRKWLKIHGSGILNS